MVTLAEANLSSPMKNILRFCNLRDQSIHPYYVWCKHFTKRKHVSKPISSTNKIGLWMHVNYLTSATDGKSHTIPEQQSCDCCFLKLIPHQWCLVRYSTRRHMSSPLEFV